MRLRFGAFVFDSHLRTITREGIPVDLPVKAFSLLEALIEARPAPVHKNDLYERLWPKTFVEPGNLHNLVSEIRNALGDDDHAIIRTVHGFGYAFAAGSETASGRARFAVIVGDDIVRLRAGENIIGRDPEGTIFIDQPEVSRHHARLTVRGDEVTIEDLGSKNGTFIGSERVTESRPIQDGAEIVVGRTRLVLRSLTARRPTLTMPLPPPGKRKVE